jgi:peptidoglycan hydrolase CwlO-like protein
MLLVTRNKILVLGLMALIMAFSPVLAQTNPTSSTSDKTELQRQLDELQNQINQYQKELSQVQGQKNTLQNKVNQLKKQQASLNLQIQATSIQLDDIDARMAETQAQINENAAKIEKLKIESAQIIREYYQRNNENSLLYLLLSQDDLSGMLNELESYSQIGESLKEISNERKAANEQLVAIQEKLSLQQEDANNLLALQSVQKTQLLSSVSEQNSLLAETKGVEANYQATLSDKKKQAAAIQSRLYELTGITTGQLTFGQALEIAKWASAQTGVRAAFLLSVITQESNLGKNVGTCNRAGDPPSKSYKVIMKPTRDIEPYLKITADLGLDPETTPLSCPAKNKDGSFNGWGGAMGPAQFIPSTWMGYKDKVTAITGKTANPWDIRDAFLASAIKLKAGGAGTVEGEWAAAMRYFSGSTNLAYRFYGDNVVARANQYQADIDALN